MLKARSDAPYFYYYSPDENAFIAERADGSDRYTLFDDMLPEDTPAFEMRGPGWSPSGQWFGWVTAMESPVYIGDGSNGEVDTLDIPGRIIAIEWSPSEDILLVGTDIESEFRSYLIDPANLDDIIEIPAFLKWSPTGEFLYHDDERLVTIFDASGDKLLQLETMPFQFNWLDNRFIYKPVHNVILIGEVSNPSVLSHNLIGDILTIDWNETQQKGMVYVHLPSTQRVDLWLISLEDERFHLINEDVTTSSERHSQWSPSGNVAWFYKEDFGINILEKVGDEYALSTLPDIGSSLVTTFLDSLQWLNDDKLIIATDDGTFIYDLQSGNLETLDVTTGSFVLSADQRYIAGIFCPTTPREPDTFCIYDMTTGKKTTIPPHPESRWEQVIEGYINWHPTKSWIIVGETQINPFMLLRTVKANGSIIHNTDVECIPHNRACYGWLP